MRQPGEGMEGKGGTQAHPACWERRRRKGGPLPLVPCLACLPAANLPSTPVSVGAIDLAWRAESRLAGNGDSDGPGRW